MPKRRIEKRSRHSNLPDVIQDPVLGKIVFKVVLDDHDGYEGKVKLNGKNITLDLYTDADGQLQPCILRARRIVQNFPAIETKMHRYIAKQIYPTYNEIFRPGKKPFTFEQLLSKLKLAEITTHPTPEATFWFDAGNTFMGHCLQLFMGERNRIVDHDMPG